jgi:hypothetical protein
VSFRVFLALCSVPPGVGLGSFNLLVRVSCRDKRSVYLQQSLLNVQTIAVAKGVFFHSFQKWH